MCVCESDGASICVCVREKCCVFEIVSDESVPVCARGREGEKERKREREREEERARVNIVHAPMRCRLSTLTSALLKHVDYY